MRPKDLQERLWGIINPGEFQIVLDILDKSTDWTYYVTDDTTFDDDFINIYVVYEPDNIGYNMGVFA